MKRLLLAAVALIAIWSIGQAKADLLIAEQTFADLGATGFGNAPRLLTLQQNGFEAGGTFYTGNPSSQATATGFFTGLPPGTICNSASSCGNGQPDINTDKSGVFSVASLGWATGANVGIGLDTNESGNVTGLTFDTLVLTIWNSAGTVSESFHGDGPVNITAAQLAEQQGNGNSVFDIVLSAAEQAQYNAFLAANGGAANVFASLSSSFGCQAGQLNCFPSTDGAESFLAFNQATVPGPIVGAGLPGLIAAGLGMLGFNRFRRKRRVA